MIGVMQGNLRLGNLKAIEWITLILGLAISGCSSVQSVKTASSLDVIRTAQPYRVMVEASSPALERLIYEYVLRSFGPYLEFSDDGLGIVDIVFTSHDQENEFSKWQNSTMLMVIKDNKGNRLWTGEYTYKGGMELSGFAVNAPAEAAKLVIDRMAKQFVGDFKYRR